MEANKTFHDKLLWPRIAWLSVSVSVRQTHLAISYRSSNQGPSLQTIRHSSVVIWERVL